MYCLVPEKPLRLVYGTFYLAICDTFYEFILIELRAQLPVVCSVLSVLIKMIYSDFIFTNAFTLEKRGQGNLLMAGYVCYVYGVLTISGFL